MSKMYQLNRMSGYAAGGGLFSGAAKLIGKLAKKVFPSLTKTATQVVTTAAPIAKKVAPYVIPGAVVAGAELLTGGGKSGGAGASGGWGYTRRRRGITATELRGYRKVANLLHKEGMVSKRARGRKVC